MTRRAPIYCPYCGTHLDSREIEGRHRGYCRACDEIIFQRPAPTAWLVVYDDRDAVWVRSRRRTSWTVPGGFIEVDESAAEGAARELAEETNLRVAPDDLALLRTGFYMDDPRDGSLLSICFAVAWSDVQGCPRALNEIEDVRRCPLESFAGAEERVRTVDRERYETAMERFVERS